MGKYTRQSDPRIDDTVTGHLQVIKEYTLRSIHPTAILLAGSFGRGEGTVISNGDDLKFLSDYEICMVSPSPFARIKVDQINRELNKVIPASVSFFWNSPARIKNNRSRNLSFGKPQKTISMYELKAGSQIIYGNIDLNENTYDPREIPACEGVRLIVNRMMDVIEAYYSENSSQTLITSLVKLILACGDSLLLKDGIYHFSYEERANRFSQKYQELYFPIFGIDFLNHYQVAASYKLHPGKEIPFAAKSEFPFVKDISQKVIRFITGKGGGSLLDVVRECAWSIPLYYETGISKMLDHSYENLILSIRASKAHHPINWDRFPQCNPPVTPFQALYAAIPGLFWGLPIIDSGDREMISLASRWGGWAVPKSMDVNADSLARSVITMWHILG